MLVRIHFNKKNNKKCCYKGVTTHTKHGWSRGMLTSWPGMQSDTTKDSLNCVNAILSINFSAAVSFGNTN